jgi:putative transposase
LIFKPCDGILAAMTHRAIKLRFYPRDDAERTLLAKTFGCARFVYNFALELRNAAHDAFGVSMSYEETSRALTGLKLDPQYDWLKEPSSVPLQRALANLDQAYQRFFKKLGNRPAFKTKDGPQSAGFGPNSMRWDAARSELTLAKMERPLAIRWSRKVPKGAKLLSATVSLDCAGRYHIALNIEDEIPAGPAPTQGGRVGIDWGLKHFATLSTGEKVEHPKPLFSALSKLARAQRRLSRKTLGSKRRRVQKLRVARLHAEVAARRKDFLHKLSASLVERFEGIAVETIAVKNLMKNRSLSRAIADCGWGEFVRQLEYKCAWRGRKFVKIDRFAASTKTCCDCGHKVAEMKLSVREWACPQCGAEHDRDVCAAKNVERWAFGEDGEPRTQQTKEKKSLGGFKRSEAAARRQAKKEKTQEAPAQAEAARATGPQTATTQTSAGASPALSPSESQAGARAGEPAEAASALKVLLREPAVAGVSPPGRGARGAPPQTEQSRLAAG